MQTKNSNITCKQMYMYNKYCARLRAIALYRWMAGEPGGFRSRTASPIAVCLTVIVCLKSNGNDICAGSRFNN